MRFAYNLQVSSHTFDLAGSKHWIRAIGLLSGCRASLLVRLNVNVQYDLLKDLKLLPVFIHTDQLLKDVLWDKFSTELTSDYRCTQMTNELVF